MTTVRQLLDGKSPEVHAVAPEAAVIDAIRLMAEKGIGAVLVMDGPKLVGILSERDYARKIVLRDRSSRDTAVAEIMTAQVVTVSPGEQVEHCLQLVTDYASATCRWWRARRCWGDLHRRPGEVGDRCAAAGAGPAAAVHRGGVSFRWPCGPPARQQQMQKQKQRLPDTSERRRAWACRTRRKYVPGLDGAIHGANGPARPCPPPLETFPRARCVHALCLAFGSRQPWLATAFDFAFF